MNRGPEVTEEGKWNQALAVGRAKRKYQQRPGGNRARAVEPGKGRKWNQALAVGRAKSKHEQRP